MRESSVYQAILREGWDEGLQQGLKHGLQQGLQQGLKHGLQQGLRQGLQQGRDAALSEVARNLLQRGTTPAQVVEITGLSLPVVQALVGTAGKDDRT